MAESCLLASASLSALSPFNVRQPQLGQSNAVPLGSAPLRCALQQVRCCALQVEDFESWLKTESQRQQKLKPHEEPSLLSALVDARLELLRKPFNRLKAKKKPKPPPAPKAPANETADAKAEAAAEQQAAAEDTEPQHHEGARLFKCVCYKATGCQRCKLLTTSRRNPEGAKAFGGSSEKRAGVAATEVQKGADRDCPVELCQSVDLWTQFESVCTSAFMNSLQWCDLQLTGRASPKILAQDATSCDIRENSFPKLCLHPQCTAGDRL